MHAPEAPASSLQLKVEPAWLDMKEKLAVVWFVGLAGEAVIVATGGVRSTVQAKEAGTETFPAASVAVTVKTWLPARRPA